MTKEIFELIKGFKVQYFEERRHFIITLRDGEKETYSINDLFFEAKDWCAEQGYMVLTGKHHDRGYCEFRNKIDNKMCFVESSEQEALIKAVEMIKDEIVQDNLSTD